VAAATCQCEAGIAFAGEHVAGGGLLGRTRLIIAHPRGLRRTLVAAGRRRRSGSILSSHPGAPSLQEKSTAARSVPASGSIPIAAFRPWMHKRCMGHEELVILARVAAALVIGALIGFERTFHGRPAGFRTHALVCVASALLMLVTVYQNEWMTVVPLDAIRTDPTRMAQGIMTGIGFLGAGVIFKEGLTVRGLTTAASIWVTAAIGILIGVGFHYAALVGAVATLLILSAFRYIELRLPTEFYAHHALTFARDKVMAEEELQALIGQHGFSIANLSYRLTENGKLFEYRMVLKSRDRRNAETLAQHLRKLPEVVEFRIAPTGD
jgi:putative Mg2+ transporter-C (MgtC) family protein